MPRNWILFCGHIVPMREHEQPHTLPRLPRMCPTCRGLRDIDAPAGAGELRCAECGVTTRDGRGWRADIASDGESIDENKVMAWCPACWEREFGN